MRICALLPTKKLNLRRFEFVAMELEVWQRINVKQRIRSPLDFLPVGRNGKEGKYQCQQLELPKRERSAQRVNWLEKCFTS